LGKCGTAAPKFSSGDRLYNKGNSVYAKFFSHAFCHAAAIVNTHGLPESWIVIWFRLSDFAARFVWSWNYFDFSCKVVQHRQSLTKFLVEIKDQLKQKRKAQLTFPQAENPPKVTIESVNEWSHCIITPNS